MSKAVIVLSGGLDSTTCMGIAKEAGYQLIPITFYYGQRHVREVEQAKKIAEFYGVSDAHRIVPISLLGEIGGSALTDRQLEVPEASENDGEIPSTYVPARNLIFLSMAASLAEVVEAEVIYLGVSAVDYSGYPDCRPEFIRSMQESITLATRVGTENPQSIRIETPLIHLSKAETILRGWKLGVPYHLTTSCYQGEDEACGQCDSCRLRLKGFAEAGLTDPIRYKGRIVRES